jgi:hypothetical protein
MRKTPMCGGIVLDTADEAKEFFMTQLAKRPSELMKAALEDLGADENKKKNETGAFSPAFYRSFEGRE